MPRSASALPLFGWPLWLTCALFLFAGAFGHDPWKTDDAVHLGVAWGFLRDGFGLVPRLAGEAWAGSAPLFHWLAAATGWLLQWLLPFHDGARLASALLGALTLVFVGGAARRWLGREAGLAAPLLLLGCLGWLVPLHEAQPANVVVAAHAAAYWSVALRGGAGAGAALGGALAASFLAGGADGPMPIAWLVLVPLVRRQWMMAGTAVLVAAAAGAAWPLLLAGHSPDYLRAWWQAELAALFADGGPSRGHAQLLAWFTWPLLPLAAWTLWLQRRQWTGAETLLPLAGTALCLALFLAGDDRPLLAMPLLVPLTLLAAAGAGRLRRGAANAFDWFGSMTFTLVAALVWLGGVAMLTGWPGQIARNFAKLEPGFEARLSVPALVIAAAATVAWLSVLRLPRSPWRATTHWGLGLTTMWLLVNALWLPWIDYGKTYRPVAEALRRALPKDPGCIARRELGTAQRASLDYFAGIRTVADGERRCRWLLVQGGARARTPEGWAQVWEGSRPSDKSERWRLYARH